MKHFTSLSDVESLPTLLDQSLQIKNTVASDTDIGRNKTLGLVFFNASLRTRMSMTKAAYNLGMNVIVLNVNADTWQLEFEDGSIMDGPSAEHIKEAVPVICSYCDILGVRSFPSLTHREEDYAEKVLHAFLQHGTCPIVNLESATQHPLQSLADLMTIQEYKTTDRPKVVMTWAPHIKPLPQSVPNSFVQWAQKLNLDLTVTHPEGLELCEAFVGEVNIEYNQTKALEEADFVYVKNWSSYKEYGQWVDRPEWKVTLEKLHQTRSAKLMHCLPVRRNVVIADDALDSPHSIVVQQAANRLYTAQAVLTQLLKNQS